MKILITGATGLIGKEIGKKLSEAGHEIIAISRDIKKAKAQLPFPATIYEWSDYHKPFPLHALKDVEAVINLAGESIGDGRWTKKTKKRIYDSRIIGTRKLANAIIEKSRTGRSSLKTFISASAIGIYHGKRDDILYEDSHQGSDFLAHVCKDWESEARTLSDFNIRVVTPRFGIVLSRSGGALTKLIPLFTNGIGSAVGSGKQWMSWIHHDDLTNLLKYIVEDNTIEGALNAVAPNPVTNQKFSEVFAKVLNKKLFPKVPGFVLKIVLGEMSTLVLSSQRVSCSRAIKHAFQFKYEDLKPALTEICEPLKKGFQEYFAEQWVPRQRDEVFQFFCDEKNLERLTPPSVGFKVIDKSTESIVSGTKITYKLSMYGLKFFWKAQISDWNKNRSFVDTQLKGPYKSWQHTHEFIPMQNGTLIRDRVLYKLPMGFIGNLVAGLKVKMDIQKIFSFRRKALIDIFN